MATKKLLTNTNMVLGPLTAVLFPHTLPRLGYTVGHGKSKSGWLQAARTFHVGLESGNDGDLEVIEGDTAVIPVRDDSLLIREVGTKLPLATIQGISLGLGEMARQTFSNGLLYSFLSSALTRVEICHTG